MTQAPYPILYNIHYKDQAYEINAWCYTTCHWRILPISSSSCLKSGFNVWSLHSFAFYGSRVVEEGFSLTLAREAHFIFLLDCVIGFTPQSFYYTQSFSVSSVSKCNSTSWCLEYSSCKNISLFNVSSRDTPLGRNIGIYWISRTCLCQAF